MEAGPNRPTRPSASPPRPDLGDDLAQIRADFARSLRALKKAARLTLVTLAKQPELMSKSTISKYLRGEGFPEWEWVDTFVTECLSRYHLDPQRLRFEQAIWKKAWRQAQRQRLDPQDMPKVAAPEPQEKGLSQEANRPTAVTQVEKSPPPQKVRPAPTQTMKPRRLDPGWRERYKVIALFFAALIVGFLINLGTGSQASDRGANQPTNPPSASTTPFTPPLLPLTSGRPPVPLIEGEVTLPNGRGLNVDTGSVRDSDEVGMDISLSERFERLNALGRDVYLAVLPDPVKLERRSCENAGFVTNWTQTITGVDKLAAGTHICVFTGNNQLTMLIVEKIKIDPTLRGVIVFRILLL
jgi:Helix-turn-helix domain